MLRRLFLLAAWLVPCAAGANEAAIRQSLEPKMGGARIESVQSTPMQGVFEVRYSGRDGPQVLYTDEKGSFILDGNLYDARTGRNLTEERLRKLSAISFSSLPLELAVKVQRGNGRRQLAVFSDPYCPACQQFEKALASIEDITVYYFMYPVIRPELADHSKAVWCSPDRARAWMDLALRAKPPTASATCDAPMDKLLDLGKNLKINSTPTMVLANGERVRGGMPAAQLRSAIDEAMKEAGREPAKEPARRK